MRLVDFMIDRFLEVIFFEEVELILEYKQYQDKFIIYYYFFFII